MKLKNLLESTAQQDAVDGYKKIAKVIQSITTKEQIPAAEKLISNWYNMLVEKGKNMGFESLADLISKYKPDTRFKELSDFLTKKKSEIK